MPSIADIYSYIDSLKRRGSDFIQNPGTSLQQMVGYANDRAGAYNQALSESAREPLTGPKTQALASQMAEGYSPTGMTLSYRGQHLAPGPDFGAPLHDLTGGGQMYPSDVYSASASRIYGGGMPYDKKAFDVAQSYRNKPNASVTIYRAVPNELRDLPDDLMNKLEINPGDWVTLTKEYAKDHGESALRGQYKIISKKVKAKDVWTNADSIHEFGYQPSDVSNN